MSEKGFCCPYCGETAERGVIRSPQAITWNTKKYALLGGLLDDGAVELSPFSFLHGSCVTAYLCRRCKKVVIDLDEGKKGG